MPQWDDLIEKHARRVGVDPETMKRIMRVESSGRANEQTGSYKGLFQLSDREFRAHGGTGSAFDPEQNTMAAANKIAQESRNFKSRYGRDPTLTDIYMVHQQGEAGYAAHLSSPDAPAWKNMYFTREGQQKGAGWAKDAIWGNLPKSVKQRIGSKDNIDQVTSKDFVNAWDNSIQGGGATYGEGTEVASKGEVTEGGHSAKDLDKIAMQRRKSILGDDDVEPYRAPRVNLGVPTFESGIESIGRRGIV